MSKELELLQEAIEWMHELKYVRENVRDSGDYDLLELIADINNIELLLAQPEQPTRNPLSYEHLEALADEYEGCPMMLGRAVEKAHGITGVDDE